LGDQGLTDGHKQWWHTQAKVVDRQRCGQEVTDGEGVGVVELWDHAVLLELMMRPEVYQRLSVMVSFLRSGMAAEEEAHVGVVAVGSSCNHVLEAKVEATEPFVGSGGDGGAQRWPVTVERGGGGAEQRWRQKAKRGGENGMVEKFLCRPHGAAALTTDGGWFIGT
jgi:hypothetical protein